MFFGKMSADEFLSEMVTEQTVSVDAGELRELLQTKRSLEQEVKCLKKDFKLLLENNQKLRNKVDSLKNGRLEIINLNTYA